MVHVGLILIVALFGFPITETISVDTFYIMTAISLATAGICQEISKLKDKPTDKKDNDDKKE